MNGEVKFPLPPLCDTIIHITDYVREKSSRKKSPFFSRGFFSGIPRLALFAPSKALDQKLSNFFHKNKSKKTVRKPDFALSEKQKPHILMHGQYLRTVIGPGSRTLG